MIGVAVVSVVLRVRQYAVGRSLWHDEALLALVIGDESLADLVTRPLPRAQVAPPGFLAIEDLSSQVSDGDQWLRLVPLLGSFGLIWLAWRAAAEMRATAARLVLLVAVTWSPVLVYYSSELKQYGLDATATMALIVGYQHRERHPYRLLVIGVLAALFSHPALIVLAAISIVLGVEAVRAHGPGAGVRRLVPFMVAWGGVALLMSLQLRRTSDSDAIDAFWADSFAPLPDSAVHLRWWWESALGFVHLATALRGIASQQRLDSWTEPVVIVSLLVVVGAAGLVARDRPAALVLPATTILVSLTLAGLEIYPFRGRLILYLIPMLALVVAHAVDALDRRAPVLAWVLCGLVILRVGWMAGDVLLEPDDRFDMVAALGHVEDGIEPGEVIVLGRGSAAAFEFYADDFDLGDAAVVTVETYDAAVVIDAGGGAPVWFVASHVLGRDLAAIDEMDNSPEITESWSGDSAVVRRFAAPSP